MPGDSVIDHTRLAVLLLNDACCLCGKEVLRQKIGVSIITAIITEREADAFVITGDSAIAEQP